jgi:hypothetical protein
MKHIEIAKIIIDLLEMKGVPAYVHCEATTSSVYIRFADPRNASIRIGDHDGKSRYRYKWNVRTDKKFRKRGRFGWMVDRGIWRYYTTADRIDEMVLLIAKRADLAKTWPKEYDYGKYEFKKAKNHETTC